MATGKIQECRDPAITLTCNTPEVTVSPEIYDLIVATAADKYSVGVGFQLDIATTYATAVGDFIYYEHNTYVAPWHNYTLMPHG